MPLTSKQKVIAWVSIAGAGLGAGLVTAVNFYPDLTGVLTTSGTLIGAIVAYIVTRNKVA